MVGDICNRQSVARSCTVGRMRVRKWTLLACLPLMLGALMVVSTPDTASADTPRLLRTGYSTCLLYASSNPTNPNAVKTATCSSSAPRQMWSFVRVTGSYYRIENPVDDRCLTGGLFNETPDVGTSVCRDNSAIRLWDVRVVSGSWNTIRNRHFNLCLTDTGGGFVGLRACSGSSTQRWRRS
jgi:ricin-type beta-trefoil lectin protein